MTAIYPRRYCRQFSGSRYWEASQAAVFPSLYGGWPAYTADMFIYFTLDRL